MTRKRCNCCGKRRVLSAFARNKARPGGISGDCKECHRLLSHAHYRKHRTRLLASQKRRRALKLPVRRGEPRQPQTKTWVCVRCNKRQIIAAFSPASETHSGHMQPCKTCARPIKREQMRRWSKRNKGIVRAANRAYGQRNRVILRQRARERAKREPVKATARRVLSFAVRWGLIKKPSICQDCRKRFPKKQIHGHHTDYKKPTKVVWVCRQCHGRRHWK